jgi:hypothetical protein
MNENLLIGAGQKESSTCNEDPFHAWSFCDLAPRGDLSNLVMNPKVAFREMTKPLWLGACS